MLTKPEIRTLYTRRAARYDATANLYYLLGFREWWYRRRAIRVLELRPGDCVVELGCGTGLNFGLLQEAIAPGGRIVGVDMTEAMLEQAQRRVERHGWENVSLLHADVADFEFPPEVAGVLSTFAITLVPELADVIRRGLAALPDGRRFVVADLKMPTGWARHLLPLLLPLFRPFGVTRDLADRRPWELLCNAASRCQVEEHYFGYTYIASGTAPAAGTPASTA